MKNCIKQRLAVLHIIALTKKISPSPSKLFGLKRLPDTSVRILLDGIHPSIHPMALQPKSGLGLLY
jgi:hypothetical protein